MNDFDYDVMQRKRVARGARNRKCGSKSRRCTLPQDNMSPAELKRRNSAVNTYHLNQPMGWEQFKSMPEDLQREYISNLRARYAVGVRPIAAMFGVTFSTLHRHLTVNLGMSLEAARATAQQLAEFEAFTAGIVVEAAEEKEPAAKHNEELALKLLEELKGETKREPESKPACIINEGAITLTGSIEEIAETVKQLLGGGDWRVCVEFERRAEA